MFLSCTTKDQFQEERVLDSVFSINELAFNPLGESFSFTYSADRNWQISKPEWLQVIPDSGQPGTYEITVSARINNDWFQRTGSISVDAHEIKVTQDYPYIRITYPASSESTLSLSEVPVPSVSSPVGEITADYAWNHSTGTCEPFHVQVESNVEWEMEFDEDFEETYFSADDHQAGIHTYTDGKTLDVLASRNNYQKQDMETSLTIRAKLVEGQTRESLDEAIATYHVALHQNHLLFLINDAADDVDTYFDELGYLLDERGDLIPDTFTSTYKVECEIDWEAKLLDQDGFPIDNSFVQVNTEYGESADELRLEIRNHFNPFEAAREMIVRLSADNGEAVRDIRVTQRPYIFEIGGDGQAEVFENGELDNVHQLSLRTTGAWGVEVLETDPLWLNLDSDTAAGEATPGNPSTYPIRYWAHTQNLHLKNAARSTLRFTAANGLVKDVVIAQNPFVLRADYDADDLQNISATRTSERKLLSVSASNAWTLKQVDGASLEDTEWYAVSSVHSSNASYNQEIAVGAAQENPSETDSRSFTMMLTSDIHEAMTDSEKAKWAYEPVPITLRQRPFTFRVNGKATGETATMTIPAYKVSFSDYLDIDCDGSWTIDSWPGWTSPAQQSDDTDRNVPLSPKINLEKTARSGVVVVSCLWNGTPHSIQVELTQEALVFDVTRADDLPLTNLDPDINYNNGAHKPMRFGFNVVAPAGLPWRLTSSDSNFIAPVQSMSGSGTATVAPTYNSDLNNGRESVVSVSLDASRDARISNDFVQKYAQDYSWTFTQQKFVFDVGNTGTTTTFRSLGALKSGNKTYNVKCSGPWDVYSCPDWIHLKSGGSYITEGTSNLSIELVADENLSLDPRGSSQVTIRSLIGGYTKSIPVAQDAYFYGFTSSTNLNFATVNPNRQTIKFRSSGAWTLENADGWGFSETSGSGDDSGKEIEVTVTPSDYLKLDADHTGTVTLRSTQSGTSFSTQTLKLNQPKYIFDLSKTSVPFTSALKSKCTSQNVSVSCTASWSVTTGYNWVKISNGSGTGNGSFTVTVDQDNLSFSERTATLSAVTRANGTKVTEQTITVTQPAYELSFSPANYSFSKEGQTRSYSITCTGSWVVTKASDADNMISSFTASGNGNGTLSVAVNANTAKGAKERTATLQVKCENSDNLVKTITLKQSN